MPIPPPTLGLSFGSFGDIVTVLQLAWELRAALDESAGASAELRALVGDVDAFTRALQDVQANIERRKRTLRPDVVNGIAAALSRCRAVLSNIQQRIQRARGQTSSPGWQRYWGTTAWSILGGKKDVEALRARLSEQLGIMQIYLSLSEAQERIHDVLMAHGTTLEHIYTIVQDIQLRFDVGVPGFQFYDSYTHQYYPPLARTSLQRLREVYDALRPSTDYEDLNFYYNTCSDGGIKPYIHGIDISTLGSLIPNCDGPDVSGGDDAEFYFFREAAFGEWQVLVSARGLHPREREALKTLLERGHTVGVDCNCAVSCATRYRDYDEDLAQRHEVSKLYSEAVALIFQCVQPDVFDRSMLHKITDRYIEWPDVCVAMRSQDELCS